MIKSIPLLVLYLAMVESLVSASPHSYVAMLATNRPTLSQARFKYSAPTMTRFVEMDALRGSYLLKLAPTEKALATQDSLTTDIRLRAQVNGGYWAYTWDAGGFQSTDYDSMRLDGTSQGWSVARAFQADSFLGELPFLGIPDYWDSTLEVDATRLTWSYLSTNKNSPRKTFKSTLRPSAVEVITDIEYPDRRDSFRHMLKRVEFDKSGSYPAKLTCLAGPSTNELRELYVISSVGSLRFDSPNPASFVMTNYFASGSRGHTEYKLGNRKYTEISDPERTSISILGMRVRLMTVRYTLWGSFGVLTSAVVMFMARHRKAQQSQA